MIFESLLSVYYSMKLLVIFHVFAGKNTIKGIHPIRRSNIESERIIFVKYGICEKLLIGP